MEGLKYLVEIEFQANNKALDASQDASKKTGEVFKSLGKDFVTLGKSAADAYTGAIEKVGGIAATIGKGAIAAGIAGAVYGVAHLNSGLESTQTSLAAILTSNGITDNIEQGLGRASAWVQQIKKDADALPGEFEDLLQIVQSSAGSAFQAGLGVNAFEKMASQSMAAGKALAVPLDQAGRELAQLLDGKAGAQNVLGSRLGIKAEGFNTKSGEERIKMLQEALSKFEPAIAAFSGTFDAQLGTLQSNIKGFATTATQPLFEKVKATLVEINAWFDQNQATVASWSKRIGDGLSEAFEFGKEKVKEYWPLFKQFAESAYERFSAIWKDIKPLIQSVGDVIKEALQDPGTLDKIISALKLYAAIKGVGLMGSIPGIGGKLQLGAGVGIAAGLGVKALGGQDSDASILGGMAGGAALGGSVGGPAGAAVGAAGGLALGTYKAVDDAQTEVADMYHRQAEMLVENESKWSKFGGVIDTHSQRYSTTMSELIENSGTAAGEMFRIATELHNIKMDKANHAAMASVAGTFENSVDHAAEIVQARLDAIQGKNRKDKSPKKGPSKGAGSATMIVYQTISSNQSPDQIARKTVEELVKATRNKKFSQTAPNYSRIGTG